MNCWKELVVVIIIIVKTASYCYYLKVVYLLQLNFASYYVFVIIATDIEASLMMLNESSLAAITKIAKDVMHFISKSDLMAFCLI